ncbi:MAG: hypothetical protein J6O39_04795 [Treponema sp.]|nr:hypothetical protein [Treponema sp.]
MGKNTFSSTKNSDKAKTKKEITWTGLMHSIRTCIKSQVHKKKHRLLRIKKTKNKILSILTAAKEEEEAPCSILKEAKTSATSTISSRTRIFRKLLLTLIGTRFFER